MNAAWVLAPVAVAASSLLFVDSHRRALRALGLVLLFGGVAGIFAVVLGVTVAGERESARCASQGGVPANGECWVDGVVQ